MVLGEMNGTVRGLDGLKNDRQAVCSDVLDDLVRIGEDEPHSGRAGRRATGRLRRCSWVLTAMGSLRACVGLGLTGMMGARALPTPFSVQKRTVSRAPGDKAVHRPASWKLLRWA